MEELYYCFQSTAPSWQKYSEPQSMDSFPDGLDRSLGYHAGSGSCYFIGSYWDVDNWSRNFVIKDVWCDIKEFKFNEG